MATRKIGNINVNYTVPEAQTQLYNALGRTAGEQAATGSGDNFFVKRGKSIENAIGTTLAAPISFINDINTNNANEENRKNYRENMNAIAQKYGYNTYQDVWDALEKAKASGDTATENLINNTINPELQAQANANNEAAGSFADNYADYRKNDYISNKINQDNTKYLGSAINTMSTALDLTGLTANPLGNAIQGGVEGFADELEQNGGTLDLTALGVGQPVTKNWENFDVSRAGQNALVGAATGAVTGALNKGISNKLAKNGGNLFKGSNALTKGLNNLGSKTALGRVGSTLATGAARGAVSGAVGGATGAGLSSALQGSDIGTGISNALQGAVQGAKQGAVTGGIMAGANMAISKTPGVGKFYNDLQTSKQRWDQSGSNFDERLTNTLTSGDSAVGDWLMNKRQSKVLGSLGSVGNSIRDYTDKGMGPRKAEAAAYEDLIKEYYDEDMGGIEGALRDAQAAAYPGDSNFRKAQRLVEGGGLGVSFQDAFDGLKSIYGDDFNESVYLNKDGSWKYKNGEPYVWTVYKNKLAMNLANKLDAMDAGTYQPSNAATNSSNTQSRIDYLVNEAENGTISYAELAELQEYAPQILASGDVRAAELAGIDEADWNAYQNGDTSRILRKYGDAASQVNMPKFDNQSANDLAKDILDWEEKVTGKKWWLADANGENYQGTRNLREMDYANAAMNRPQELYQALLDTENNIRYGDGANALDANNISVQDALDGLNEIRAKYNIPTTDQMELTANNFSQPEETPTTAKGWLKRAGKRALEDLNDRGVGLSIRDVSNETPETEIYRTLTGNTGSQWDNIAQEAGYATYDDAINAFVKANPNAKVNAGSVLTWLDNNPGDWNPNMPRTNGGDGEETTSKLAYGESNLGSNKKTLREKVGLALERSQVNATRKEMRDIGIQDAGELVDNVRRRTGLSDLDDQAQFAREITGGKNSLLDTIQNDALSTNSDGSTRMVDLTGLDPKIRKIVADAPDTLISTSQKDEILAGIRNELTNPGVTAVQKANDFRASASELYTKNAKTPNKSDVAEGNIYSQVAGLVEDEVYNAIPKENVDWMYDTAIKESNGRAQQLAASGNKAGARAYTNLANDLATSDRSIKNFRSLKKDFVDVNKLATKTSQGNTAWNNNGLTVGTAVTAAALSGNPITAIPAAAAAKLLAPAIGEATTKGAAKLGGKIADWGRNSRTNTPVTTTTTSTNTNYNPATQLYNALGRTEGLTNAEQARTAQYLADATQNMSAESGYMPPLGVSTLEDLASTSNPTTSNSVYNTVYGNQSARGSYFPTTGDYWTDILGSAMSLALDANDATAFGSLYTMYQNALAKQEDASTTSSTATKLTDKQRQANAAAIALDDFEQLDPNFAYDVSDIPVVGTIANFGGNEYRAKAEALALQIGYMLSGGQINKDEAKNIGMAYVPQPRESEAARKSKLDQIRGIISEYQRTYAE